MGGRGEENKIEHDGFEQNIIVVGFSKIFIK
jgi:hypothetical protein